MKNQNIIITGATGFIGRAAGRHLTEAGYSVLGLTRQPLQKSSRAANPMKLLVWDAKTAEGWAEQADGAAAILNLAGENVGDAKWTQDKKRRILQSRLDAAGAVLEAMEKVTHKPRVLIQASAIGYYGDRGEETLKEGSSPGRGFLPEVVQRWEEAAGRAREMGVRVVILRLGVVLGFGGGILAKLLPAFRRFAGGYLGSGKQWFSWIHLADVAGAIQFLLQREELSGVFHLTAPVPLRAKEFGQALGHILHRPALMPVPALALRILYGEMADALMLASQRVLPGRLREAGYPFRYPEIHPALEQILTDTSKSQENESWI